MLLDVLLIFKGSKQEALNFHLLQEIILRHCPLGAEIGLHRFPIGAEGA